MALIYLFNRLFFRIKEFFRHWYVKSFFIYTHAVISFLEKLDRYFALKITLRFIFHPLYSDRSVVGYVLGFIFRFSRLIITSLIYLLVILLAIFIYIIWLLTPIFIFLKIINFNFQWME